jgi:hypothetical protein
LAFNELLLNQCYRRAVPVLLRQERVVARTRGRSDLGLDRGEAGSLNPVVRVVRELLPLLVVGRPTDEHLGADVVVGVIRRVELAVRVEVLFVLAHRLQDADDGVEGPLPDAGVGEDVPVLELVQPRRLVKLRVLNGEVEDKHWSTDVVSSPWTVESDVGDRAVVLADWKIFSVA